MEKISPWKHGTIIFITLYMITFLVILFPAYSNEPLIYILFSFKVTHGLLSVQTNQENKTLDNYQSNVNILQVSTPFESTLNDHMTDITNASHALNSSGFLLNNSSSQNSNVPRKESSNSSSKTGRPILGKIYLFSVTKVCSYMFFHLVNAFTTVFLFIPM